MSAQASVFYGELANTWSCLKAARAHQIIAPQLLALDMIILRRLRGTLKTSLAESALSRCPVEVLTLIKDELYPLGLASVVETWAKEFADWVTDGWEVHGAKEETPVPEEDGSSQDYSEEYIVVLEKKRRETELRCMAAAKAILTSKDWEDWAEREEFGGGTGYVNWTYQDEDHSALPLQYGNSNGEVTFFGNSKNGTLGLSATTGDSFNINGERGDADVSDLYLPISLRFAHPSPVGITLKEVAYESFIGKVINITSTDQQTTFKPFKILFEKYHVEFAPCGGGEVNGPSSTDKDKTSMGEKDGSGEKGPGKVKEKLYHPKPSWKLQCGLWTEW